MGWYIWPDDAEPTECEQCHRRVPRGGKFYFVDSSVVPPRVVHFTCIDEYQARVAEGS